ncbi:Chloramphenicol acetyltransferase-like domain containing protein [Klebsormidium nitens]|uniref:Chloramphenicol acetyltransferase-like domain containing protein n=1 Tax=Klebsormidium nitens TaxID=105231 RepID=A0A1Y1HID1_KLENI|nr:Chloramphenicol acetyltransferase-like domain containing protein [Klebsormidium nitens]|eukprot:GAQ78240.1 Chloramphenicol acetyltransferase-like domain containing protein [Klebsormidium nitens]
MRVTVVSDELVKPETSNRQHPKFLELSVLDQVQFRYHWPPLLAFFDPPKVPFYPLAGRFVHRAEGCLAIDCNDAGILVRVAEANCKTPQAIATGMNMAGSQKLYVSKRGEDVTTVPPLLVQFTRFQDDAISVSFCFHHTVCDAAGYSMFINYWSELMREKQPSLEPNHERFRLPKTPPSPLVVSDEAIGMLGTQFFREPSNDRFAFRGNLRSPLVIFHEAVTVPRRTAGVVGAVTSKPLAKGTRAPRPGRPAIPIPLAVMLMFGVPLLRRRALPFVPALKADASQGLPAGRFVSTNDALTALLWLSITAARGLDPKQVTRLGFPVNVRSRTEPPLPEAYFGNASLLTTESQAAAGEVTTQPLSWSASIVRDTVSRVDAAYANSALDQIRSMPDKDARASPLSIHRGPDVFLTSFVKFPFNEIDLGWGPPVSFGVANLLLALDGFIVLVETMGGVCAYVGLLAKHMARLLADETFMKYVGL